MDAERSGSDTSGKFIAIRKQTGMNKKEFAAWLGVPYRTMEDWELGATHVPEYLLKLVDYKVTNELAKGNLRESVIDNLQKKKQGIEKSAPDNHIKRQKEASR